MALTVVWSKWGIPIEVVKTIHPQVPTVLSTSLGKTVFAWCFILDENILFWMIISCQKLFVFSVYVFCSTKCFQKLNLWPNVGLSYVISIVQWCFDVFV